jgi:FtsP/CotA-like multicopper oxidase with cupredoxin domain
MSNSVQVNRFNLNRRRAIQIGAAGTAAGLLASERLVPAVNAKDSPPGPKTSPFVMPLVAYTAKPTAGTLTPTPTQAPNTNDGECGRPSHQRETDWPSQKFYEVHVKEALHQFHPDLPTQKIWGYDGIYPGPTFVERYNVPVTVRIYNDLLADTSGFGSPEITTHLHNLHDASESDGFTGDYYSRTKFGPTMTAAGAYKDHHYPNCYAGYDDPRYHSTDGDPREALGTLWYHDHRIDFTGPNVYRGLAGFYLLFDELDSGNELDPSPALGLPSGVGTYDIPLLFQDKQFDSSGYLFFDQFNNKGILGNKFCVNGRIQPYFQVERRKYRFRLLDGGPSRFYEFYLTDRAGLNQSFTYIGNDGNLLPAPLTAKKVALGVAERADIVIDFSKYNIGDQLFIVNRLIQTDGRGPEGPSTNLRGADGLLTAAGTQILRFDIAREPPTPDLSRVPPKLRELPPINLAEVVANRRFEFDKENEVWTVNGKIFDVENAVAKPKRGTAEIWTLKGKGSWHHPVHIHFEEGRILSRNGKPPPPHESGRKDVYVLEPDEEVRVFIRFRDFLGKYMMHCHNLIHEDHAMMIRWDIVE